MSKNSGLKLWVVVMLLGLGFSKSIHAADQAPQAASTAPTSAAVSSAKVKPATGKSCEDLKSQIDAKLKAKGVKTFTLEIVGKEDAKDAKVVGSCEGGSKKIIYKRG